MKKEPKVAPRSRSETSEAFIPYYLGGALEPKKLEFWEKMIAKQESIKQEAQDMLATPSDVSHEELVTFVCKSIRSDKLFTLAWHAEMLDQRRFMLTMASEINYRTKQTFIEECVRTMGQSTIWRKYSQWLRSQPNWRSMSMGEHQREYTRVQKEEWAKIRPLEDAMKAELMEELVEREGITLDEIRKAARSTPVEDAGDRELAVRALDYALMQGFVDVDSD